jgi:ATP-binding cassette, subfamily B, multidrug efflux pump
MQNLFTLKQYFLRYKSKILLGILFIVISNLLTVYVPIILKDAINDLQNKVASETLFKYAALIIGVSLIAGVFRYLIRQTIIVVSREIEYDLRNDFWSHIQKLPLRYFQNNSTGNIMSHATNDINSVRSFIGPAIMYFFDTVITLGFVITILFTLDYELTLYALLPLPFISIGVYAIGKVVHAKYMKIQENFSRMTTQAQENFSGIRAIKSYVREQSEINKWDVISIEYFNRKMNLVKVQALIHPLLYFIAGIAGLVVILVGGNKVISGTMNLGDIVAFVAYLSILIWPVIAFGWIMNIIQQGEASMKRLNKIFSEPYEIEDSSLSDLSIKELKGEIEFSNVSFKYAENLPEVLKDVNLKIPVGSTLAIVGHTGSGKTSFINLIPRLYDVVNGEIKIDGKNIKQIPLDVLRTNISVVQQESFLFSDSVYGNISYGLREISKDRVKEVSRIANFDKDVEAFPKGYETMVGERGITFSGGQKQRASLARALATDPKILILDDSFSAVDTHTEEEILKNLRIFMKNRTSIIISHRISTVKDADNIIVLENGNIAEQGTHNELVELNGIYAELHYKQLLEKELEELN